MKRSTPTLFGIVFSLTMKSSVIALSVLALFIGRVRADVITITIGDDDGFGGTQVGGNSDPGDPFQVFNSPTIAPGATYTNLDALDVFTRSPWTPYTFVLEFPFDASGLGSIDNATVTVQTGSLGRRTNGSGFGYAEVFGDSGSGNVSLGDFQTFVTGSSNLNAPQEEFVRLSTFDVTSLITPTAGILVITIDGSSLTTPNPIDLFALDFAQLRIEGPEGMVVVPEPSSWLLTIVCFVCGVAFMRTQRLRRCV